MVVAWLWQVIGAALRRVSWNVFAGKSVAVDVSVLIHRALTAKKGGVLARAVVQYQRKGDAISEADRRMLRALPLIIIVVADRMRGAGAKECISPGMENSPVFNPQHAHRRQQQQKQQQQQQQQPQQQVQYLPGSCPAALLRSCCCFLRWRPC